MLTLALVAMPGPPGRRWRKFLFQGHPDIVLVVVSMLQVEVFYLNFHQA